MGPFFNGNFFSGGFFAGIIVEVKQLIIKLRSFTEKGRF